MQWLNLALASKMNNSMGVLGRSFEGGCADELHQLIELKLVACTDDTLVCDIQQSQDVTRNATPQGVPRSHRIIVTVGSGCKRGISKTQHLFQTERREAQYAYPWSLEPAISTR